MTPKEKAIYLYLMFKQRTYYVEVFHTIQLLDKFHNNAKDCALIAVDEIIKIEPYKRKFRLFDKERFYDQTQYWKEVKQEIEKL